MLYGILMRVVYCQDSWRGVMTQVWIPMCLYCYFFQIKSKKKKKLKLFDEYIQVL